MSIRGPIYENATTFPKLTIEALPISLWNSPKPPQEIPYIRSRMEAKDHLLKHCPRCRCGELGRGYRERRNSRCCHGGYVSHPVFRVTWEYWQMASGIVEGMVKAANEPTPFTLTNPFPASVRSSAATALATTSVSFSYFLSLLHFHSFSCLFAFSNTRSY